VRNVALIALGALAACAGACAALSGLDAYHDCAEPCEADDGMAHGRPVSEEATTAPDDAASPGQDVSTPWTSGHGDAGDEEVADGPLPLTDSGPDVALPDALSDAEAGVEASLPDAGVGPTCGPLGTLTRCTEAQVCCANPSNETNSCAATCATDATLRCSVPSDCPAAAPLCCAHLSLTGSLPPCTATSFSSVCAATCADNPPTSCSFTGTIRLCAHDSDCTSDSANPLCYNFNNAPTSWCTTSSTASLASGKEQK
jgi:hypothetical protein